MADFDMHCIGRTMKKSNRCGKWTFSDMEKDHWDKFPVFETGWDAENAAVQYARERELSAVWIGYLDYPDINLTLDEFSVNFDDDDLADILDNLGCAMNSAVNYRGECYAAAFENLDWDSKHDLSNAIYGALEQWLERMITLDKIPLAPHKVTEHVFGQEAE